MANETQKDLAERLRKAADEYNVLAKALANSGLRVDMRVYERQDLNQRFSVDQIAPTVEEVTSL